MDQLNTLKKLIGELEQTGCACDLLYGSRCGIHDQAREAIAIVGNLIDATYPGCDI